MKVFNASAWDPRRRRVVRENIQRPTRRDAIVALRNRELVPFGLEEVEIDRVRVRGRLRMQKADLYNSLARWMRRDILPHDQADALRERYYGDAAFKPVIERLIKDSKPKTQIADLMAAQPNIFSPEEAFLVRVGRLNGKEPETLELLARIHKRLGRIERKIFSALWLPILISILSLGVFVLYFTFTLPQMVAFFHTANQELPPILKTLLSIKGAFTNPSDLAIGALALGGAFLLTRILAAIPAVRFRFDYMVLHLPGGAGDLITCNRLLSTSFTMLIMVTQGQQHQALDVAARTAKGPVHRRAFEAAAERLRTQRAKSWEDAFSACRGLLPAWFIGQIRLGIGQTEKTIETLIADCEQIADEKAEIVPSMIVTALILLLGTAAGFLAWLVWVPTAQATTVIH